MSVAQKDILNGWKEIAGYVTRDIRTVERWEKTRGLPVRRVPGAGRATVYARISELEEWLASAKPEPDTAVATPAAIAAESPATDAALSAAPTPAPELEFISHTAVAPPSQRPSVRLWLTAALAAMAVLGVGALLFLQHSRLAAAAVRGPEASPGAFPSSSDYRSGVPGVDELYLRGTYFCEQRTPDALSKAQASFSEAIARDPGYAPAYAGLANTYNLLREYSAMTDEEAYPKARAAAEHAIALNPKLALAHVSLGFVLYYWYMDAAASEHEFQTAIALDPGLAQAHHWYGSVLTHEGRFPEALRELETAQHLQPASAAILTSRAFALGVSGHALESRTMLQDLLSHESFAKDGNSSTAHRVLAIVSAAEPRDYSRELQEWHVAGQLQNNRDLLNYTTVAAAALKRGGDRAMWQAILQYEEKAHPAPGDRTLRMVECEANLGLTDRAFADLNHMADRHDTALTGLSMNPMLQPLHTDPRYAQLRARLGLPPVA